MNIFMHRVTILKSLPHLPAYGIMMCKIQVNLVSDCISIVKMQDPMGQYGWSIKGKNNTQKWIIELDILEEGVATHSSILAWRIPWTEEPGGLQYIGSWRVGCGWSNLVRMHKPGILFSGEGYVDYGRMGNNCIILTRRRSNQSILKEISPGCSLEGMMHFGHLMRRVDSLEKTLMLGGIGGRRRRGRQRMRWHHQFEGREFEWTLGVGDGQGGLACCSSWDRKESDMAEWLNWTEQTINSKLSHRWKMGPFFLRLFVPIYDVASWGSLLRHQDPPQGKLLLPSKVHPWIK